MVEYQLGDGVEQQRADASSTVGDTTDEEVDTGVVRAGPVVVGERVEIGPVDLPITHRGPVEHPETRDTAAVSLQLRPQMTLGDGRGTGQLPERGDRGVVHPVAEERKVAFDAHRHQAKAARGGGRGRPLGHMVQEIVAARGEPCAGVRGRERASGVTGEQLRQPKVRGALGVGAGSGVLVGDGAAGRVDLVVRARVSGSNGDAPLAW
jgi:hypothetical protein